jgi:LysM repeat protein
MPSDGHGRDDRRFSLPASSPNEFVDVVEPHQVVRGICPYLGTGEGWRLAVPDRAHRCLAVSPPTPLALDKQSRLCLVDLHAACATFLAAAEPLGADQRPDARVPADTIRRPVRRRWPVPRTQATVLDVGRGSVDVRSIARARATTQVALVVLALVAFGALLLARIGGLPPVVATAGASPSSIVEGSTSPAGARPPQTADAQPTVGPSPTAEAAGPSPLVGPSASLRRYTVRAGDTLLQIARRYGTSVKALQAANSITNPADLQIGQVLRIP